MSGTSDRKLLTCVSIVALAAVGPVGARAGDERPSGTCSRTARDLAKACGFGVRDAFYTAKGACRNTSNREDRRECFHEAHAVLKEEGRSCVAQLEARQDACELLGENRYSDPLPDPAIAFIDPDGVPGIYAPNSYLSLAAGHTYVLAAGDEGEETVVVHVTDETREILGVPCRVVLDAAVEAEALNGTTEYEAVEVTDDWFAQDEGGNVYYCGELSRDYEDGLLRDLGGSFEAGIDFAMAGQLIRAFPAAADAHRQEYALGEAEDIVQYLSLGTEPGDQEGGDNDAFPCNPDMCLKTLEFSPLEPESSEFKYYLPGTGFVLAVAIEDGEVTGEREELVCVGDSLDVLRDPACGIEDPQALREALCEQAAAFCD